VLEALAVAALVVIAPPTLRCPSGRSWRFPASGGGGRRRPGRGGQSLFGGRALKGPADRVMAALGLPSGNAGVLAAYDGLLTDLVVDEGDRPDVADLGEGRCASTPPIPASPSRLPPPA